MILHCYVDDETLSRLREAADEQFAIKPTANERHQMVVELAENAIAEAALADWKGRQS